MTEGVFAHWPNRITAMRFVGAAVLFVLLSIAHASGPLGDWFHPVVFWLFILTAATDFLDGWLARRGNQVTAFGRIADPFVDKVLVLGTFILLAVMDFSRAFVPAWIVVVVLAREFLVTGIRGYVESLGHEFPADWFGKIKMTVQCIAIGAVLGLDAFPWPDVLHRAVVFIGHAAVWATLLTSVGSGLSYAFKTRRILGEESA